MSLRHAVAIALILIARSASAQVLVPPQPANQLSPSVARTFTFNQQSGVYTYAYVVSNAKTSVQEISLLSKTA